MKHLQHRVLATSFMSPFLLGLIVVLVSVQPLSADELKNVSDVKSCRLIEARAERLLCYDTVVDGGVFNQQKLKQAQVESFGSSKMKVETKTTTTTTAVVGTETKTTTKTKTKAKAKTEISVDEINVTIVRVKKDANGIHYFQTSDGQVWKQQSSSKWSLNTPFEVEIKEGTMGSFFLINEGGKSTRVKRVR